MEDDPCHCAMDGSLQRWWWRDTAMVRSGAEDQFVARPWCDRWRGGGDGCDDGGLEWWHRCAVEVMDAMMEGLSGGAGAMGSCNVFVG
jgi:hypothetical protein